MHLGKSRTITSKVTTHNCFLKVIWSDEYNLLFTKIFGGGYSLDIIM